MTKAALSLVILISFALTLPSVPAHAAVDMTNEYDLVRIDTKHGHFLINLYPQEAPVHVQNFKRLVSEGFYDGLYFHRVIPSFVVQAGDPTLVGRPAPIKYGLPLEAHPKRTHERGAVGMARLPHDKNSASTQFYIVTQDNHHLDGDYTVFGKVIHGMGVVHKIQKADKILKAQRVPPSARPQ